VTVLVFGFVATFGLCYGCFALFNHRAGYRHYAAVASAVPGAYDESDLHNGEAAKEFRDDYKIVH
jgi:hypothetical protein